MAINERLIHTASDSSSDEGNQQEGLILHLDANDVDSYDGDGSVWYDITNHEYQPEVNPAENFNTVLYTGDGNANGQSVTDVGFQPDLTILKSRVTLSNGTGGSWMWFDSLRGPSNWNRTDSVMADATTNGLASFDADGFTTSSGYIYNNQNAKNYVAYNFKAGGAPSGNDKVSIDGTSYSTMTAAGLTDGTEAIDKLSVNTKLGFSIVKYTAPALTGDTVAHGLGETPEMIILKSTSVARNWNVYHKGVGTSKNLHLNTTDPANTSEYWTVNANTFSIQDYSSSSDWIAYCFTSKRGVSKVGSFNGENNPTKIYTGFQPAWIMIKNTSRSSNSNTDWQIFDNKRSDEGEVLIDRRLRINENSIEAELGYGAGTGYVRFESDGVTLQGNSFVDYNYSGDSYIYLAFAAEKATSLIDDTDLDLHLDPASYSGSGTTWTADVGNDGTITGASYDQELGDWFDFDGSNDYVDLGTASSVIPAGSDFTVESWVNPKSISDSKYWAVVSSVQSVSPYGGFMLYFHHTTDHWGIAMNGGGTWYSKDTGVDVATNKWVHLAFTYDGSNMKLFVDGEEKYTTAQTNSLQYSNAPSLELGRNTSSYSPIKIGQTRLYSKALSEDQVLQNYRFTKNDYPNGNNATGVSSSSFNTNGYFNVPTGLNNVAFPINFKKDQTLVWWAKHGTKTTADSNSKYRYYMFDMKTATYSYWHARVDRHATNGYQFQLTWRQDSSNYFFVTDVIDTLVNQDDWNMYACYFTGTEGVYYSVNGGDWISGTATTDVGTTSTMSEGNFLLGKLWSNGSYYSNPNPYDISDIKIFDKVLSSDELSSEYSKGQFGNN